MVGKAPVSPKRTSSLKQASMRKRLSLSIFLVIVIVIFAILSHVFINLLIYESEIEITTSRLKSNNEHSTDYRYVSVDVTLYNPSRPRGTTVWVEITDQPTTVSFSKTQYIPLEYRELKTITFDFTLDRLIYQGEFSHRTWLTYPSSQD